MKAYDKPCSNIHFHYYYKKVLKGTENLQVFRKVLSAYMKWITYQLVHECREVVLPYIGNLRVHVISDVGHKNIRAVNWEKYRKEGKKEYRIVPKFVKCIWSRINVQGLFKNFYNFVPSQIVSRAYTREYFVNDKQYKLIEK